MNYSQSLFTHIKTISRHKRLVRKLCFRAGLYKQGICHDLSKWSITELATGALYADGKRSPIENQKDAEGYSESWLHHFYKNKHHWEYWQDVSTGERVPMPWKYVYEMAIDRISAAMVYQGDKYTDSSAIEYFEKGQDKDKMDLMTAARLTVILACVERYGIDYTIKFVIKARMFEDKPYVDEQIKKFYKIRNNQKM